MAFRVKDLMISVLPGEGEDLPGLLSRFPCHCGHTLQVCTPPLSCVGSAPCPDPHSFSDTVQGLFVSPYCCPMMTAVGPVGLPFGGDPAAVAQQLAALKSQLREAIAQIEKQEKLVSESAQPQSVAEIEQLQGKLKEALDELERRKSELKKP